MPKRRYPLLKRGNLIFQLNNFILKNFPPGEQHYYRNVCAELNLPCVPLFEEDVILTPELIKKYEETEHAYGFPFEGVVVTGNGFSFKIINLYYDSNK